jgi:hypothetical protein
MIAVNRSPQLRQGWQELRTGGRFMMYFSLRNCL